MATLHSFYLPPELWGPPFTLEGPEAHHLDRVLRLPPGRTIRLFDGEGRSGLFCIEKKNKKNIFLERLEETLAPRPPVEITLACGFSKALRRGWFLEKAVELEASALWLWQGDHSQCSLPDKEKQTWKANLVSGAKQCENPWLPSLRMLPGGVADLVAEKPAFTTACMLYEGDTKGAMLTRELLEKPGKTLLVIGPEGGFSPNEAETLAQAGIQAVSLGNRVLRWETAAIMALGLAWWARQG